MFNQLIHFIRISPYPFTLENFSEHVSDEENLKPSIVFILLHSLLVGSYQTLTKMDSFDFLDFLGGMLTHGVFVFIAWLVLIILMTLVPAAFSVEKNAYSTIQMVGFLAMYAIVFNVIGVLLMKTGPIGSAFEMLGIVFSYMLLFRFYSEEARSIHFGMMVTLIIAPISLIIFGFLNVNPFTI